MVSIHSSYLSTGCIGRPSRPKVALNYSRQVVVGLAPWPHFLTGVSSDSSKNISLSLDAHVASTASTAFEG